MTGSNRIVVTFGTFDVFHIGHLNILKRARLHGDTLIVGVSSDRLNIEKKDRAPVYPETERMEIVRQIKAVSDVFLEDSLELKGEYLRQFNADALVMGDDWEGKFDHFKEICDVIYLPRTEGISTTQTITKIKKYD
ncbi:adenylyltransferase/cytidyltransferase family protein [Octadecabacter sp. 1_MG-2023]|uniref:adenylyltransferase/cytidyltransferase family protein n=1 Tax=unclassified Octadecabacter TaxID=196158 RepID=UPI001C09B622|nr:MULTISPECIES: adenylyltransferase/cytidyltransferase family protein [unclassified Octadecabacter]MBU2994679.1 adenylyltransferase/cytidyltransferase family protein [Octadecabacter sp. B2R22]MDO6734027.1 adenylyltransferase/cytidyltransferase family protein [Octadecabacter sp. 1_MG-2023]